MISDQYGANFQNKGTPALYQPAEWEREGLRIVQETYQCGYDILHKPYPELNDKSVIEDENNGTRMFNSFVDETVEDEADAWKWRGTRSKARNKGIGMHAQLTAAFLIPTFIAQNEEDEVDTVYSDFMRSIVEWMTYPNVSDYQSAFITAVFGMMYSPVTYMGAEYVEVMQRIRERAEDGTISYKEILDSELSGFRCPIFGPAEVLITNAYQRNIQRQTKIIKRAYVPKEELKGKYGEHRNWAFVEEGKRLVLNADDGLFYEMLDEEHPDMCEVATWLCRTDDTEICTINGIYFGDEESIDANPIAHRDNKRAPKYNVTPFGYYRINQHFFFYKSMMNTLRWENGLYDAMSELVMNRALLEQDMPLAISGSDEVDTAVIFPGSTVTFEDPTAKATPLLPQTNMQAGFQALRDLGDSMDESTIADTQLGQLPSEAGTKAVAITQAAAQAKKIITNVARSMGESITAYGMLMKDIAINNITVPQAEELIGGSVRLKYRSFMLPNKNVNGRTVNKVLKFDESMLGREYTQDEIDSRNLDLLKEIGYPNHTHDVYLMNPEIFANFDYYSRADIKELFAMNEEQMQGLLSNLYGQLANDPLINREGLLKKLLYSYFQTDGYSLVNKQPQQQLGGGENSGVAGAGALNKSIAAAPTA